MKLKELLKIADIHTERITMALSGIETLLPLDAEKVTSFTQQEMLLTDLLINRFGKLQDVLGNHIFNQLLMLTQDYEENMTMLDKIHKLEKIGVIADAEIWKKMRQARNYAAHEYPDHPELTAIHLNNIANFAPQLIQTLEKVKMEVKGVCSKY